MGCGDVDIGLLRCKIGRLSVTGEMGYEIHCRMGDHIALRRLLLEAGAASDIREFGFNALFILAAGKKLWHLVCGIYPRLYPCCHGHG